MITTVCLNSNSRKFTENCLAADISELREVEGNVIWADVTDPTSQDFEELAEEFGFHHLSIEDCQNAHQRPSFYRIHSVANFADARPVTDSKRNYSVKREIETNFRAFLWLICRYADIV